MTEFKIAMKGTKVVLVICDVRYPVVLHIFLCLIRRVASRTAEKKPKGDS